MERIDKMDKKFKKKMQEMTDGQRKVIKEMDEGFNEKLRK